ncbi:unnamed protein product [Dibothriocephalus latus]|uniref:Uncharacterized protein n=1 Tax=Dibothriocephalus latus TaxID=60516 RepID=A0A3P7MCZ8_DIBLA|nr:unnamed protein product [Dibothriocephalus latus]
MMCLRLIVRATPGIPVSSGEELVCRGHPDNFSWNVFIKLSPYSFTRLQWWDENDNYTDNCCSAVEAGCGNPPWDRRGH